MRLALAVVVVGAAMATAGCGGDDETYSVEEARAAFAHNGIELVVPAPPELAADGRYLAPSSGESYVVVVATDAEVDDAWPDERGFPVEVAGG